MRRKGGGVTCGATRRAVLVAGAAASLRPAHAGTRDAGIRVAALRDVAGANGLRYGCAVSDDVLQGGATESGGAEAGGGLARLVAEQSVMVAPNLSWAVVGPAPGILRADAAGGAVAFARVHGMTLTGAHLLWYRRIPSWFQAITDPAAARAAIVRHIAMMGARYADATWSINVVNEAFHSGDRLEALFGPGVWDFAFHAARQAFPGSLLLWNEDGLEQDHGDMMAKRVAVLARLDRLRRAGTPIDGIGVQAHLSLARRFDAASFVDFLAAIAARGLRIVITELDVADFSAPSDIAARDRAVADLYRRFLAAALSERAVAAVVSWGLSDRTTWLNPRTLPQFARADGLPSRPLPFDAELRPKPAFFAMLDAFANAPRRPA